MSEPGNWVQESPFTRKLGVEVRSITRDGAELYLPFLEANSNPGGALHGGVYASLSVTAAHAVTRAALDPGQGPFHTAALQINYLSAAINEGVTARARLLRRGKELVFVEVTCGSDAGKDVSHAAVMVRGRRGVAAGEAPACLFTVAGDEPGEMGPAVAGGVPFIRERGILIEHMAGGESRLVMPWIAGHGDADGNTHEGAVLALLDTAGAMAGWAVTGPGPYKASTPAMQAQVVGAPPRQDLVAYARARCSDNEIHYCDVEVAGRESHGVCARGTIIYRIVT
jgi:uncharacterized protein (TIGR00369 family)